MPDYILFALILAGCFNGGFLTAVKSSHTPDVQVNPQNVSSLETLPVKSHLKEPVLEMSLPDILNEKMSESEKGPHRTKRFSMSNVRLPKIKWPNLKDLKLNLRIDLPPSEINDNYNISYATDGMGNLIRVDLNKATKEPTPYFTVEEGVRFELFTPRNPKEPQIFTLANATATSFQKSHFNRRYPTRIVIHGWNSQGFLTPRFAEAYFEKGKHKVNYVAVNWRDGADTVNYFYARNRVNAVAEQVARFIDFLADKMRLRLSKDLHVIGHSLGAHVSGIAGKKVTRGKISKIVALDPALPLFAYSDSENRLADTDAEYVEVIHTCSGLLGYAVPLGHASFYPNGGKSQPGCGWDMSGACAHGRAYEFYIESIHQPKFYAFQCESFKHVQNGTCEVINQVLEMGGEPGIKKANGVFYLQTNDAPMFSRDDKDILMSVLHSSKAKSAKKWYMFWKTKKENQT